jgi:hypothetical protein
VTLAPSVGVGEDQGVNSKPHHPHPSVAEEHAAVKRYLDYVDQLLKDEVPRPRCPVQGCRRRPQRRGQRVRTDVRDSNGDPLAPIPILRFYCLDHGWIPTQAWCLLPWVRTVALAVEAAVETYVVKGLPVARVPGANGEGERSARRWVARLADLRVDAWVQRALDALRPLPRPPTPCPAQARPNLWPALVRVRHLAEALRERGLHVGSPLALLWSFRSSGLRFSS